MLDLNSPELEELLRELMALTGETNMEEAIATAVAEKLNLLQSQPISYPPDSNRA